MAILRILDQTTLIEAIQVLRQYQIQPEPPSLETRKSWIEKLAAVLRKPDSNWVSAVAAELGMTEASILEMEFHGSALPLEKISVAPASFFPRGLIAILSPRVFPIRLSMERLGPALLAGNTSILKISSQTPRCADVIAEILTRAEIPEKAVAISAVSRRNVEPFFTAHPAIRAVSFVGQHASAQEIAKSMDHVRASFQAWTGGVSVFLVMEEPFLDQAAQALREEIVRFSPQSPLFPSKVFVLDKFVDKAREVFSKSLEGLEVSASGDFEKTLNALKAETARVVRAQPPAMVENLPNCSEFQQSELRTPILQLTSVKYTHEMAKWINNGFYGYRATIFGDPDKARKLAGKLEVGRVTLNKTFDPTDSFLFGAKESAIGNLDPASFFHQRRQFSD